MKFSGLFRKNTKTPEVSEASVKDSLNKLWQTMHNDVFTADKAREASNDKFSFAYLDRNILTKILKTVQESAERHKWNAEGIIEGVSLSRDEIDYCIKYLNHAGYQDVYLNASTSPKYLTFHVRW